MEESLLGKRGNMRSWYKGEGMLRQLSCEKANRLSSPSHAHNVFSDGHSSNETLIGLATGTELQLAALLCLFSICMNPG